MAELITAEMLIFQLAETYKRDTDNIEQHVGYSR
jgi:hypothetical protein